MLKSLLRFGGRVGLFVCLLLPLASCREPVPIVKPEPPVAPPATALEYRGEPIFIRVLKREKTLELFVLHENRYELYRSYPICAYSGGIGPKKREGDRKTPEGFYGISRASLNPASRYHLAMNIGYPNTEDVRRGYTGSFIMIHGACVSVGCIAMTDPVIEEIYSIVEKALDNGQGRIPVHIYPFRMTPQNLEAFATSEHIGFWKELAVGYERFIVAGQVIDPYAPRPSGFIKVHERRVMMAPE